MKQSMRQKIIKSIVLILVTWAAFLLTYLVMRGINKFENVVGSAMYELIGILVLLSVGSIIVTILSLRRSNKSWYFRKKYIRFFVAHEW